MNPFARNWLGGGRITTAVALAFLCANPAHSQNHAHHQHGAKHHDQPETKNLTEGGQGAFTALAEAVARLEADPSTDWRRINVDALREHLVDMNLLMLESNAKSTRIDGGLRISVSAAGRTGAAIRRMVPAHAHMLTQSRGWQTQTQPTTDGVMWVVTARSAADAGKIQALGFYGLMALEQHHQAHHWAIIRDINPHHH